MAVRGGGGETKCSFTRRFVQAAHIDGQFNSAQQVGEECARTV